MIETNHHLIGGANAFTEVKVWNSWGEYYSSLTEERKERATYTYNSSTEAYVTACDEWIEDLELINYQRLNLDPYHIIGQHFCDWFTPSDADWIDTRAQQIDEGLQ